MGATSWPWRDTPTMESTEWPTKVSFGWGSFQTGIHLSQDYTSFAVWAAFITSSAWPVTLTLRHALRTLPSGPTRKVLRSMPMYLRPYIDFSTQVPYRSATA